MIEEIIKYIKKRGVVDIAEIAKNFEIDKGFTLYLIKRVIVKSEKNMVFNEISGKIACKGCPYNKK